MTNERKIFSQDLFATTLTRFQLRIILAKGLKIPTTQAKSMIFKMEGKTDDEILQNIKEIINARQKPKKNIQQNNLVKANKGSILQVFQETGLNSEIERLKTNNKDIKYLDIGVGNGVNTLAIMEILELELDQTYGLDIEKFEKSYISDRTTIYDGTNIPFHDNQFDFISIFQVLHHVNTSKDNIHKLMGEISRILKPGGILLLKEHNCHTPVTEKLIFLEHLLYDLIRDQDICKPNCLMSKNDWFNLFKKNGLIKNGKEAFYKDDPTRSFYSYFIKII